MKIDKKLVCSYKVNVYVSFATSLQNSGWLSEIKAMKTYLTAVKIIIGCLYYTEVATRRCT